MPKYVGRGTNFHLIICELLPSSNLSKQEKIAFATNVCSNCGYFKDTLQRQKEALEKGKLWRKLICIHPKNKTALERWKQHVTVWGR